MFILITFAIISLASAEDQCLASLTKLNGSKKMQTGNTDHRQVNLQGFMIPITHQPINYDLIKLIRCIGQQTHQDKSLLEESLRCEVNDMYANRSNLRMHGHLSAGHWQGSIYDNDKIIGYYQKSRALNRDHWYQEWCYTIDEKTK